MSPLNRRRWACRPAGPSTTTVNPRPQSQTNSPAWNPYGRVVINCCHVCWLCPLPMLMFAAVMVLVFVYYILASYWQGLLKRVNLLHLGTP